MALWEVHRHPEIRRYKAPIISTASVFQVVFAVIILFASYLVAYSSYGFWLRSDYYTEQPQVNFEYDIIVVLNQNDINNVIGWSTFPNFNQMLGTSLRVPFVTAYEVDLTGNGLFNYLNLSISFPLQDWEQIYGAQVMLFFNYNLSSMVNLQMQSLGYMLYESVRPACEFRFVGDLQFVQTQPLAFSGIDLRYNTSIFNATSIYADAFNLDAVIANYTRRNVSTWLQPTIPLWITGRGSGQPFRINAVVNYVTPVIQFVPGFWQNVLWVWMQYVPILLVFVYFFDRMRYFIFDNQVVDTLVLKSFESS